MHAGRESGARGRRANFSVGTFRVESARRSIIWGYEWIERILNRHANAFAAYSEWMGRVREYIRHKWNRRQSAVPETPHIFEITKKLQVLPINFAVERAVEVFTVHRGHCRCESGEVKELLPPRQTKPRHILRVVLYVWERMWRWCQRAVIKLWLVNKVSDAPSKIARPKITTPKKWR